MSVKLEQGYLGSREQKETARKQVARNKQNRNPLSEPTFDYRHLLSAKTQLKLIASELGINLGTSGEGFDESIPNLANEKITEGTLKA